MWLYRTPEGGFRCVVDEPIRPDAGAEAEEDIRRITRLHVAALERAILVDPAQYLWFHRRWKTRPKKESHGATDASDASRETPRKPA